MPMATENSKNHQLAQHDILRKSLIPVSPASFGGLSEGISSRDTGTDTERVLNPKQDGSGLSARDNPTDKGRSPCPRSLLMTGGLSVITG